MLETVRRFVDREVIPAASGLEHDDAYPHALVARLKELGLFGATIPPEFGGLGLDYTTYSMVIEEIGRGWMSLGCFGTNCRISIWRWPCAAICRGCGR